jgi:hypothetical protein
LKPTAAPESLVISPAAAAATSSTTGAAGAVGVALGAATVGLSVAAAQALLDLAACSGPGSELSFPLALIPTARVGADAGAIERAAVLLNTLLTFAGGCVMLGVGLVLARLSGSASRGSSFGSRRQEPLWLRALTAARMPGTLLLLESLSMQGTVAASVRLARVTESAGGDAVLIAVALAFVGGVVAVAAYSLARAVRVGGPLRFTAAYVSIIRPRDTVFERIARSQAAANALFGRAMWRTSRVGAGTDVLDPVAVRVGVLFLGFRGPRPLERIGGVAPRFFFVPLACSFVLGFIQGFADYCDRAAWAAAVVTGLLLVAYAVLRPSIVPLSDVLNILKAVVLFLAAFLLGLRSALPDAHRDDLTRGASACAIIVLILCFVSVGLSFARRVLLWAARARLQQDDRTGAARDLAAAAGERTEGDDLLLFGEGVNDDDDTLMSMAVLKIPDASSNAEFVPDASLTKSFLLGTNDSAHDVGPIMRTAEKPRAAAATTVDADVDDLLLDGALLETSTAPTSMLARPSLASVVRMGSAGSSTPDLLAGPPDPPRPVLSPLSPLTPNRTVLAPRPPSSSSGIPTGPTAARGGLSSGSLVQTLVSNQALTSSPQDDDLWGTL